MTAEGYDYEYGHSMFVFDDAYYGTRSSTTTTYHTEVTVDPPPWTCKSCYRRKRRFSPQNGSTTACFPEQKYGLDKGSSLPCNHSPPRPGGRAARRRRDWLGRTHGRKEPAALLARGWLRHLFFSK